VQIAPPDHVVCVRDRTLYFGGAVNSVWEDEQRVKRTILGIAVSLLFLWLAFRGLHLATVLAALRTANYWVLIPALACYFAGVAWRAVRWSALLRPVERLSWVRLFPVVAIGYMANNVLPLRTGEVVRAYTLAQRSQVRTSAALASIALERLLDGLTMLGFLLVASLFIALTGTLWRLALAAIVIFLPALALLALLSRDEVRERVLPRLLDWLPARIQTRVLQLAHTVAQGLRSLQDGPTLAVASATSLAAWLCEAGMYGIIARGFGLPLSIPLVLLTTAIANLATLLPSSPGYVGPFEAGVTLVLTGVAAIARERALSYALVLHVALYVPITLLGLVFWWRESLSWRVIRTSTTERVTS